MSTRWTVPALVVALGVAAGLGGARAQDKKDPDIIGLLKKAGVGDKPFTLVVHVQVKPEGVKRFEEQAAKTARASAAEKGCITYEVHKSLDKPGSYVFFEKWKDLAAIDQHFREEHTKAVLGVLGETAAGPPEVRVFTLLGEK